MASDDQVVGWLEAMWFGSTDTSPLEEAAARSRAAGVALRGLQPFPASVAQVAAVVQRPGASAADVERVLSRDPVIASRVLALASSSQFGTAARLASLRDAVVRLGSGTVYEMVVEVALQSAYADLGGVGDQVIAHSADVARCVRMLTLVHPTSHRFLYLAALLHDVGKLLLLQSGERASAPGHGDEQAAVERSDLGFDHALLGAVAARSWGIPAPIPAVIGLHHDLGRAIDRGGDIGDGVATLRVAQDLLRLCADEDLEPERVRQVCRQTAWQWLQLRPHDAHDLVDLWHQRGEVDDAVDWKQRIRSARRRHDRRSQHAFAS